MNLGTVGLCAQGRGRPRWEQGWTLRCREGDGDPGEAGNAGLAGRCAPADLLLGGDTRGRQGTTPASLLEPLAFSFLVFAQNVCVAAVLPP